MSAIAQDFGYFFNSNNSDRTYNAESFEAWLKPFFLSGVFEGDLQVTAQDDPDMSVQVASGFANLNGKPAYWGGTNTLALSTASGVYNRIDTIVLRRDNTNRQISIEVVTGTASGTPQPTAPTRNGDIYELVLAQVYVGVGVTQITAANITDKRTDATVCGYVSATVDQVDFNQFKTQFDGWVADFEDAQAEWEEDTRQDFSDWFDAIKGQLDEDAAGHLQLEIDDINTNAVFKTDLINGFTETGTGKALDARAGKTLNDSLSATQEGIAIVATGDTHAAISSGQYVYVKEHGTLAEGMYTASAAIAANAALSSSNLTAVSGGGLNSLKSGLDTLNSKLATVELIPTSVDSRLGSSPQIILRLSGNVLYVDIDATTTGTIPYATALFNVGVVPSVAAFGAYCTRNRGANTLLAENFYVRQDGTFRNNFELASGIHFQYIFTYVLSL